MLTDLDQSALPIFARTGERALGPLQATPEEEAQSQPSFMEQMTTPMPWLPAFRQGNTIGSALSRQDLGVDNNAEPNYGGAWGEIAGTKYEQHWDRFVGSMNPRRTEALKRQIDMEEQDRREIAAAGWPGTVASIAAGVADLPTLIPGGGLMRSIKGGWSVSRSALTVGAGAALGAAAQEAALQGSQELRTGEESALVIGGAAVLGSLLGGGAAAALTRAEISTATKALRDLEVARVPSQADLSAATVPKLTTEDLTPAGDTVQAIANATRALSPNLRQNAALVPEARQLAQQLAEPSLYQVMHERGQTLGYSAETMVKVELHGRLASAMAAQNDAYREFYKAGGKLSRGEFEEAVGRAMRRGDFDEINPQVTAAAQAWRKSVFDPFVKDAVDVGLLPSDVTVETASSYFSRVYDRGRLMAEGPDFKKVISDHYAELAAEEHARAKQSLATRLARLEREERDLQLDAPTRMGVLRGLETKGERLDAVYAKQRDIYDAVLEARRDAREARERGDVGAERAAQERAAALSESGGVDLRNYLSQRTELRRRMRNVSLGYAGMMSKVDRAVNSLANLETTNERQVSRLVERARKFEREVVKLDPKARATRLEELKNSFADVSGRAERAAEKARQQIEALTKKGEGEQEIGLPESVSAEISARFEKWAQQNDAYSAQLSSIARRLEALEGFDPEAAVHELRTKLDEFASEVSKRTLMRGERAGRLKKRIDSLNPKRVKERIDSVAQERKRLENDFNARWSTIKGGENADLRAVDNPSFKQVGDDVAEQVYAKLTGLNYDGPSHPEFYTPITRGVFKDRTLNIPDTKIERWLESNVVDVARRYARQMAGEVNLSRKFGRADMRDQFRELAVAYKDIEDAVQAAPTIEEARAIIGERPGALDRLRSWASGVPVETIEKKRLIEFIRADHETAKQDIGAMRDLLRGTYRNGLDSESARNISQGLMTFNYIRSMGNFVISSLSQIYRPAMVHGLMNFMGDGVTPLVKSALKGEGAWTKLGAEAEAAGVAVDHIIGSRMASVAEIGDPFARGTAFQRMMDNGSRVATQWNGLALFDDFTRKLGAAMSQRRIIEGVRAGKDERYLRFLGVDKAMEGRIARQFEQFGETVEGLHVANTSRWDDAEAARAFRAALNKDVGSLIDKGIGDVPLFAHTPLGRVILQFQTFNLAAHQRTMLRGLQEDKARFVSGVVAMTGLGMISAYLSAWRSGAESFDRFKKEIEERPAAWVSHGIERSSIFPLLFEAAGHVEHLLQPAGVSFNPVHSTIGAIGAAPGSERKFSPRDPLASLLGPSAGLPYAFGTAVGAGVNLASGEPPSKKQLKAAAGLVPYSNYPLMREFLQVLIGDSPYVGR